jgi:hypothetical protein
MVPVTKLLTVFCQKGKTYMLVNRNLHRSAVKPKLLLIILLCLVMVILLACQEIQPLANASVIDTPTLNKTLVLGLPQTTDTPVILQTADKSDQTLEPQTAVTSIGDTSQTEPSATPTDYPEDFWKELPIFPESISEKVREVYKKGLEMGNNPQSFIRVGDCNSRNPDFLAGFDGRYNLGEYTYLQLTIDYFKGSFGRYNQTANPGMTTSRVLVSFWNNGDCQANEPMLECQFRLDNPSIAFISLGTIDAKYNYKDSSAFERNLRVVIENTLEHGIVPILVTKADNLEGDNSINATIARMAIEYELPLWNFWKAAQKLKNGGLEKDLEHLNYLAGPPSTDFSVSYSVYYGKEVRNLNGLQMLNYLMEELQVFDTTITPTVTP